MAKKLIPKKIIIDFDDKGNFKNGVMAYHIQEDGAVDSRRLYTMGINEAGFSKPQFAEFIQKVKSHVRTSEKCVEA